MSAVDSTHTGPLPPEGTEHTLAEPGIAVAWSAGYRTVGNTVDSTGKKKKHRKKVSE